MKFEPGFEPGSLSITRQQTSSASRWRKAPETGVFRAELSGTYRVPPYLVAQIYCALRGAYPAGRGNVATLPNMPAKGRRVR